MSTVLAFLDTLDSQIHAWASAGGTTAEGAVRLLLAGLAGGLVGLDREVRGREAGFRTNILVCFGSALVMIVSIQFGTVPWTAHPGVNINVDPARIAYGVMTGVGFLGAGTIVHNRGSVRGLTTAAALWCVAGVGLALGFGLYVLSALATAMIVAALWLLDYFEDLFPKRRRRSITIRAAYSPGCVTEAIRYFRNAGFNVLDASFERTADMKDADIDLQLAFTGGNPNERIEKHLAGHPKYQLLATRDA